MKGIYQIRNKINNKTYVGSSINIKRRFSNHKSMLNHNKHYNQYLQSSWNKYGEYSFDFIVVLLCEKFELLRYEQLCLDNFSPEYNIAIGAKAPMLNRVHTKESKTAISKSLKNRKLSKEIKIKMSKSKSGERCVFSKLIKERVLMIRRMYLTDKYTQVVLGKIFSVPQSHISRIVNYKTWKHI